MLGAIVLLAASAVLEVTPRKATVGDPLHATITVTLDAGTEVERAPVGPDLGADVAVLGGTWAPTAEGKAVWSGTLAAYKTGTIEVPPVEVGVTRAGERETIATAAVPLEIVSVLAEKDRAPDAKPELADLKPPATIAPDWGPAKLALWILAGLLVVAAALFLVWRRLAPRFARVAAPADPFRRLPPHVWAYEELSRLLEAHRADPAREDRFFEGLARIVKTYLSARLRVDLLERTTGEVAPMLAQAGAPPDVARRVLELLEQADLAKFARVPAGLDACRACVDAAYAVVDATKARDEGAA
jgi:hypothetical protein